MSSGHSRRGRYDDKIITPEQAAWARQQAKNISMSGVEPQGPHYKALLAFLKRFKDTEHERAVWDCYFQMSSYTDAGRAILQADADSDKLTFAEFVARESLKQLKKFCASKGILYQPIQPSGETSVSGNGAETKQDECTPSDDFSSVKWYGSVYDFTPNQAKCIAILWDHWERGGLAVKGTTLRDEAEISSEHLRHVFRGHSAWGTMIVSAGKGSYRLAKPESSEAKPTKRKRLRRSRKRTGK